jgi:nucleoside-diphosphate-sugar epimerase
MATTSSIPRKVLVFGATGLIGQHIIREIYHARSSFQKIGFFTSESTAKNKPEEINGWKEKGVEVIVGDVNSEDDITRAYQGTYRNNYESSRATDHLIGYDTVISALGRNAILSQILLIELAESSQTIDFFYPSEYGTDIEYDSSSASEKPHQLKLQVREYIREKTEKLKVTYLVTGPYSDLYFGASPEPQAGTFKVKEKAATLLGTGKERISFTTEKDVGRLLVAALKTPTKDNERILKVNSFTVASDEVLAEFEKQTGAKWTVDFTPVEMLKKAEQEAWEKDSAFKTGYTLRRIWVGGGTLYEQSDNSKLGFVELETLEEQVKKVIAKQTS